MHDQLHVSVPGVSHPSAEAQAQGLFPCALPEENALNEPFDAQRKLFSGRHLALLFQELTKGAFVKDLDAQLLRFFQLGTGSCP